MGNTKVLFLWAGLSGYMSSCWKSLSGALDLEVTVCLARAGRRGPSDPAFDAGLMGDVKHYVIDARSPGSSGEVGKLIDTIRPSVVFVAGWSCKEYNKFMRCRRYAAVPVILCSDNPYRGSFRQRLGGWIIGGLLRRASAVFVPGMRGLRLMSHWGVEPTRVVTGLYGIDAESLRRAAVARSQAAWPRKFLYIGRMERRKGVDILLKAYRLYRSKVQDPWALCCVGSGPLEGLLLGADGIELLPYVDPGQLPDVMARSGAFVIASRHDAWPLVVAEACAAGLPVICTSACGSGDELIRHGRGGYVVAPGSVAELASAMQEVHNRGDLQAWGDSNIARAQDYSAHAWSMRVRSLIEHALRGSTSN